MGFNDEYSPTCATDCDDQLLAPVGNTHCPTDATVELAQINVLHFDEKDTSTPGSPKNPILTYTAGGDNSTVITTWRGTHDNTTASKIRTYVGTGEKPEPNETEVELHKGIKYTIGSRHVLVYTINVIDAATYTALRTMQGCKGQYHIWYATDTYLYGADKGILVDVEKVVFPKSGGRTDISKCIVTLAWNAKTDPIRDVLPYDVVTA